MWWIPPTLAAETAVLRVGVHRGAGSVSDFAADGAAGLCVPGPSTIACPATGPVTFRWAGDPAWTLVGDTIVEPGETGLAWILAPDAARAVEIAALDAPTAAVVRALLVRDGAHEIAAPSPGMLERLWTLVDHPDPLVRRALVDAVLPFLRHTASDPFPAEAPPVFPPGLLANLAADTDFKVRRRLAVTLKEVRITDVSPPWLVDEVHAVLVDLLDDRAAVQKAAITTLSQSAWEGVVPAEDAWIEAMERVRVPGPPGRAAANTLARLAASLKPGPLVDPELAVRLVFEYQRERTWAVWAAWRTHVPFDRPRVEVLLRDTLGMNARLLRQWAEQDPDALAAAIRGWEPAAPHSVRFGMATRALEASPHPAVRDALGLAPTPRGD